MNHMKSAPPPKKKRHISHIFHFWSLGSRAASFSTLPTQSCREHIDSTPLDDDGVGEIFPRFAAASEAPKICLPNGGEFHGSVESCGRILEKAKHPTKTNKETKKLDWFDLQPWDSNIDLVYTPMDLSWLMRKKTQRFWDFRFGRKL